MNVRGVGYSREMSTHRASLLSAGAAITTPLICVIEDRNIPLLITLFELGVDLFSTLPLRCPLFVASSSIHGLCASAPRSRKERTAFENNLYCVVCIYV